MSTPHTDWAVVPAAERERQVIAVFEAVGAGPEEAAALAEARFPMTGDDILGEVAGRGLDLTEADLRDFLIGLVGRDVHHDGAPITHDSIGWPRHFVERLLSWAFLNGRGQMNGVTAPADTASILAVGDMLEAMRSRDIVSRIAAGTMLSTSLGAGLGLMGETGEDFEFLLVGQLSDVLGRAMAGEAGAVDRLLSLITTWPSDAYLPSKQAGAANRPVNPPIPSRERDHADADA